MLEDIWDYIIWQGESYTLRVAELLVFLGTCGVTLLIEWLGRLLLKRGKRFRNLMKQAGIADMWLGVFRYFVYILGIYIGLRMIGIDVLTIPLFTFKGGGGNRVVIRGSNLVISLLILLVGRVVLIYAKQILTRDKEALKNTAESRKKNIRQRMVVFQILRYMVYVGVFLMILSKLQINLNFLLASSAALLVGVGLALQGTFSDIASGMIILFERTLEVGDMIFIDSLKLEGKVVDIRLRTTIVETLDAVVVIVPNSKFTNSNVVNWSYSNDDTRFHLRVGVAYGSDVNLVRKVLKQCAEAHQRVLKTPPPKVRFKAFGDSSLNFELLFWTRYPLMYEDIMSDLHFKVDSEFRKFNITIPFPQRDLHIRSSYEQSNNGEPSEGENMGKEGAQKN